MVNHYDQFSGDYPNWAKWCNMQAHINGMPEIERQQEKVVTPNFPFTNSQRNKTGVGFDQNQQHQGASSTYVRPAFPAAHDRYADMRPPQQSEWHQSLTPLNPWGNQPRHGNCIWVPVYCYIYHGGTTYPQCGCQNNNY